MTATLKVLVPEPGVNYIRNPSFRHDTAEWSPVSCTATRVLDYALYGISSCKVVTNGGAGATRQGIYYRANSLLGISTPVTMTAYVRGSGRVHIRMIEGLGKEWVGEGTTLYPDRWIRLEVTGYTTGSNDVRLYVETDGIQANPITFWMTAAQRENNYYSTTFIDGDQPGCFWTLVNSGSISTRKANVTLGGRWVTLAGPCRENNDIYITVLGGLGMPPLRHNIQSWARTPGSYFQNTKVLDRAVTIVFHAKNEDIRVSRNPDTSPLQILRQQLIDVFKPNTAMGNDALLFSYQDGEREMFLQMRYEAGLEGSWDIRNKWTDSIPVRFLVVDPMFYENNKHSQALNFKSVFRTQSIFGRVNGEYKNLNFGMSSGISKMAIGKSGYLYAAGGYTTINNSAGAVDPLVPCKYISYYDGEKWNKMGTGEGDNHAHNSAIAPNGDVYVVGAFTSIGGVAANRIAKWNGTTWSALSTGLDDTAYGIKISSNGDVYVGGDFHTAGGIACWHIARWDGLSWNPIGAYAGLNDLVRSIAISPNGEDIYVTGAFNDQYSLSGSALLRVAKYSRSTNLFSAMGNGFDNYGNIIKLAPSGALYVGGDFDLSGTITVNRIAKWNGSSWISMGEGFSGGVVYSLGISENENIVAVGTFTSSGDINCNKIAFWNGSSWSNLDFAFSVSAYYILDVVIIGEDMYLSGNWYGYHLSSSINTVTNYGTAEAFPVIYIFGPGNLRWIENQTTEKRIFMDLTILDDEEILIDFGKKTIVSTIRGDLIYSILPGSDFGDFSLTPGDNKLAVFMTDDVQSLMYIYHRPQHWSASASVNPQALS